MFSFLFQGETKVLKLKNLRPKDFADYTCQVSVRNVCNIEDKSVTFRLTNATSMLVFISFSMKNPHLRFHKNCTLSFSSL